MIFSKAAARSNLSRYPYSCAVSCRCFPFFSPSFSFRSQDCLASHTVLEWCSCFSALPRISPRRIDKRSWTKPTRTRRTGWADWRFSFWTTLPLTPTFSRRIFFAEDFAVRPTLVGNLLGELLRTTDSEETCVYERRCVFTFWTIALVIRSPTIIYFYLRKLQVFTCRMLTRAHSML